MLGSASKRLFSEEFRSHEVSPRLLRERNVRIVRESRQEIEGLDGSVERSSRWEGETGLGEVDTVLH